MGDGELASFPQHPTPNTLLLSTGSCLLALVAWTANAARTRSGRARDEDRTDAPQPRGAFRGDDTGADAPDGRDRRSVGGVSVSLGGRQPARQAAHGVGHAAGWRRRPHEAGPPWPGLHGQPAAPRS